MQTEEIDSAEKWCQHPAEDAAGSGGFDGDTSKQKVHSVDKDNEGKLNSFLQRACTVSDAGSSAFHSKWSSPASIKIIPFYVDSITKPMACFLAGPGFAPSEPWSPGLKLNALSTKPLFSIGVVFRCSMQYQRYSPVRVRRRS